MALDRERVLHFGADTRRVRRLHSVWRQVTNVADNDLSPLLQLPKLRYVGTMDKRSYNYKCDALNKLLAQRDSA